MAENISTNVSNSYKYINTELSKYDTDNDGSLSVFELENIQDDEGLQLLNADINIQLGSDETNMADMESQVSSLESKLASVKDEQGAISSAWNSLKCLTGIGSSTKKCEQAIQDFKSGKITYEEADTIISEFSTKQKSSVNLVANIATGVAAVAVVASAVATGGLSLGVIAAGAAVGGATKAGIKFADRATNKVEGDALDGKQIAKDALSGAVDGAVSVATMGIGSTAVAGTTVANQTLKQTVIQGAKSGAKAGAISGAATGAADYSIEAAFEEDVDFNLKDLAVNTAMTAAGGAVAGGVMGGVTSGIQYKNTQAKLDANIQKQLDVDEQALLELPEQSAIPEEAVAKSSSVDENTILLEATEQTKKIDLRAKDNLDLDRTTIEELSSQADELNKIYEENIQTARSQIKDEFGDLESVQEVSGRAKGEDSIFAKLAKKFSKGKLETTSQADCMDAIGDAYGTRIQMKSIDVAESKELIEDCLYGYDISYDQFIKYMNGDTSTLDSAGIETLKEIKGTIIDLLKEKQTQEVVDQLVDAIGSNRLVITELNNYGDDISSYFTNAQIQEIADAYYIQTGESLKIVSYDDFTNGAGTKFDLNSSTDYTVNLETKGAIKDSGYASSQMNTKQKLADGSLGNGELQIRGVDLNKFADAEHIPYDIRTGKIKVDDPKYADVFKIIKGMTEDTYKKYNQFLTDTYHALRLKELGIETNIPKMSEIFTTDEISSEAMKLLDMDGLISVSQRGH